MTSANNRAPLLYYIKLCASFQSHGWIQTEVNSPETLNSGQYRQFFVPYDHEIWKMTLESKRPLFYSTSSFVHHFKAMGELKLEIQSGNAQFGSKLAIFCPLDLEIWRMALEINRAPLLCCFKLCASFQSHGWIQTGVTVRIRSIRVKIGNIFPVTSKFDEWPWKTIGHLFYST